jgi:hypothetical protein
VAGDRTDVVPAAFVALTLTFMRAPASADPREYVCPLASGMLLHPCLAASL